MASPGGRFLEVAGERIHVTERASGPPLLMVHGFPRNATAWRISELMRAFLAED